DRVRVPQVRHVEDHVPEAYDLDGQAGLLGDLAHHRAYRRLTVLDPAARQGPHPWDVVMLSGPDQQKPPRPVPTHPVRRDPPTLPHGQEASVPTRRPAGTWRVPRS